MTNEEVKKHPMYAILRIGMNEQDVAKAIRAMHEQDMLANQAVTEFSTTQKKIIVPVSMNKLEASQELERQYHDEETIIEVARQFNDWNWKDVLVAVKKAAEQHFGWVQGKTKHTFFGTERPKDIEVIVDIKSGKKITETCFYGAFTASAWENAEMNVGPGLISCEVKKRYSNEVKKFFDLIQTILDNSSIYRGKSITVTKKEDPWKNVSLDFEVFELKISDKIVLNDDIERIVQNFVIDDLGDEGKRCYLFSGNYGNAKTETAMRVGGAGLNKGLAFFYCKDASVFHMLLKQAVNYQPCIVFLEDVDEIGSGEQRDADMNRILNTLDGVQTKNNNLTVMFTTNHENKINSALRRPGRIDLVVKFGNPDTHSIEKIFKLYLEKLDKEYNGKKSGLDYKKIVKQCGDVPGAVVAEVCKRAVKLCVKRQACNDDLVLSAIDSMKHHLALMEQPLEKASNGKMIIAIENGDIRSFPVENGMTLASPKEVAKNMN